MPRGEACLSKWQDIPADTDVLISHTPPIGHGDLCCTGLRAGCVELLTTVQQRVKPKYHVFGHVHEGKFICLFVASVYYYYYYSLKKKKKMIELISPMLQATA